MMFILNRNCNGFEDKLSYNDWRQFMIPLIRSVPKNKLSYKQQWLLKLLTNCSNFLLNLRLFLTNHYNL